jgi:hypothetical protein
MELLSLIPYVIRVCVKVVAYFYILFVVGREPMIRLLLCWELLSSFVRSVRIAKLIISDVIVIAVQIVVNLRVAFVSVEKEFVSHISTM